MMQFQSRTKLKIRGLNQERVFNKLTNEIRVLKLDRIDKNMAEIEVQTKDEKRVISYLKTNNFEIIEQTRIGFGKIRQMAKLCYGTIAGLAVALIIYLMQTPFVWKIKVYGLEQLSQSQVVECVDQALTTRFKPQIDTHAIEIALKSKFEKISAVSAAVIGQTLVVNIHESELPDEMTIDYQPLISKFDGKITEIELIQGTLVVERGQIVRQGQILVEPFIIDSQGQKRQVKPMANIKADVWFEGVAEHNSSMLVRERTGKSVTTNEVTLFGLTIFNKNTDVMFKEYDLVESYENLSKNLILPFKVRKKVYYEVNSKIVESDFETEKQKIIEEARQKALQNLGDCEIIKDETVNIRQCAGISTVTYVLTVNREIGE